MDNTKRIKSIAVYMFFVGAILAIVCGAKMPSAESQYPDTLALFFVGAAMAIIGNILWHKSNRKLIIAHLKANKDNEAENPVFLLRKTIPAIETLKKANKEGMDFCDEVDTISLECIHPFTEKRHVLVDILGQAKGAEVLLIIAYAERMLNRAWSAASDHHNPEKEASIDDSLINYKKALQKVEAVYS